ncbi:MAG TPA: peptide ABC transporter substrate-binding protein [Rhizomicrobium sp.]|jgi:oligopeptide transport system substrate-binding protein
MSASRTFAVLLVGLVAACSKAPDEGVVLNRGNAADIKSLDPAFIQGNWENWLLGDVMMGLTTEGPRSEPIPGAAESWEVSPDGLTWTFHMRKGAVWSDGVPVTARDFLHSWQRELDPKTAAIYCYQLWIVKNARAISQHKLPPTALGVEAPDDDTFIVHLEHPAPYFPELVDHEAAWPIPWHVYLKYGSAWSHVEHHVSNGPYTIASWIPLDHITLKKSPRFYDAKNVHIDTVKYYALTDTEAALREFRAGQFDTQNPFPNDEIDWMRENMPHEMKVVPYLGTAYLVMNVKHKPLGDRRVREAINLAFNREVLTNRVRRIGEQPAYHIVPPGTANYPVGNELDFKDAPFPQRVAKAQALMREAGYGPGNRLKLDFVTSTNPDNKRVGAATLGMMKAIYIDLDLKASESGIFLNMVQQHDFDIAFASWIADFNDASNYLDLLRSGAGENYGNYSNPAYDALMDRAQQQTDPEKRGKLMKQAERMLLDDYVWVPAYFMVTREVVQPYVKGWIPNVKDFNRTRWLWIDKSARRN